MNHEWNLSVIYEGIESPSYLKDFADYENSCKELEDLLARAEKMPLKERIEGILTLMEKRCRLFTKMNGYLSFRQSANTEDGSIMAAQSKLMKVYSEGAAWECAADRILAQIPDIEALAKESELVAAYAFLLKEKKEEQAHRLSDAEEALISAMDMNGASGWSSLQSFLTSTVKVDYDGSQITLPQVRSLAHSADQAVRKAAYEAELKSYEKIEDSVAFALNNIKNQVSMLCAKRGYASPLDKTLADSRMSRETLDALMGAIQDYLPVFRRYLRSKAEKLGHKNGLPWYELFAPMGNEGRKYSLEDCRQTLVDCFKNFTPELSDMIEEAFDQEWIDFYPRAGKVGGAFCEDVPSLGQCRILTNYDGTFNAVDTLAHELGHAFHSRQLIGERDLNRDYPMPVAETASTFNETFLCDYTLRKASDDMRLSLLESALVGQCQCVVDISSRYLFETAVFEQSKDKFLMASDLKEIMLDTQRQTYGDGLDPEYLHPYMWINKAHYYISGLSFYNFPYAFGTLFSTGLYALYKKEGESFVGKYKNMLKATPKASMEECGRLMGVDLTKKDFWLDSLAIIAENIELYCKLS